MIIALAVNARTLHGRCAAQSVIEIAKTSRVAAHILRAGAISAALQNR